MGKDELGHQHDPTLLDNGDISPLDNGWHTITAPQPGSRVIEVDPARRRNQVGIQDQAGVGLLQRLHQRAQRLPNGNTLVCAGMTGRLFEITREGEIVWEYTNPFFGYDERFGYANRVFRAYRYSADFPGFKDKEFSPTSSPG